MTTLHQNLCNTIEGRDTKDLTISVFGVVSSKIRGIAVSNAKYTAIARETDIKIKTGIGHYPALGILKLHCDNSHIATIGCNQLAVGLKNNLGSGLGGLYGLSHYALAVLITCGYYLAGLINGLPLQMPVAGHLLPTEFLAVYGEFYLVAVAICPEVNLLAFVALKVPVWEDVKRGLIGPPRLQVPGLIFPETAVVQDAEL